MHLWEQSVMVDGVERVLDIPTGLRAVLRKAGLKLYRLSRYPAGTHIYTDLLRSPTQAAIGTIFDVGANVGQTALELVHYFPSAQIHSFEHASATFAELQRNTAKHAHVHCHRYALGSREGAITLNLQDKSTNNSLNPIVQQGLADHCKPIGKAETVSMTTLDAFVEAQGIGRIDLLKIDAGGYDLEILRGGAQLMKQGRIGLIFVELTLNPSNGVHCQFTDLAAYLSEFGIHPVAIYDQRVEPNLSASHYANGLFAARQ